MFFWVHDQLVVPLPLLPGFVILLGQLFTCVKLITLVVHVILDHRSLHFILHLVRWTESAPLLYYLFSIKSG